MPALTYQDEWRAVEAAGSLTRAGYKRVDHEPRSGEVRVLFVAGEWKCEWGNWIWSSEMLRRLIHVDLTDSGDHARQLPVSEFEARRMLSAAFPDQEMALQALDELEAQQPPRRRASESSVLPSVPPEGAHAS
jgi:hypothetical protein